MKFLRTNILVILALLFTFLGVGNADPVGNELLSSGRVNEAVIALTSHEDARSLNLLSRAYFAMQRWDEAVKYGERAVRQEPNNAGYHLWLAREYGRKAGDSNPFAAAGLAKKAKNEFERAVQLNPSDVQARVDLAEYYTEAPAIMGGGLDKARAQAAQLDAVDKGMGRLVLARVAVKEKRYADAENQFRDAIREARNPADMWLQLAGFYREQGRLDDMQSAVRSAMALSNKRSESYFDAGRELCLASRDLPAAMQYLQRYLSSGELVESAPAFRAHYLMGQLQEQMGHGGAAASEYRASLALASGFAPAQKALSRVQ